MKHSSNIKINKPKFNDKIVIIGAGISGVFLANLLKRYGYKNVVIIEKQSAPGGKIHTFKHDNHAFELGAYVHMAWSRAFDNELLHYGIRKTPLSASCLYWHHEDGLINRKDIIEKKKLLFEFLSIRKFIKHSSHLHRGNYITDNIDYYSRSIIDFASDENIKEFSKSSRFLYTSMGWGHFSHCPALYFCKVFSKPLIKEMTKRALLPDSAKLIQIYPDGAQDAVIKMAKDLDVRLNEEVLQIKRNIEASTHPITIRTSNQVFNADWLVITEQNKNLVNIMDCSETEKMLFSSIKYFPYGSCVFSAKGMPKETFIYHMESSNILHPHKPLLISRPYQNQDVFLCWYYLMPNGTFEKDTFKNELISFLKSIGAYDLNILKTKIWQNYFPHYSIEHVKVRYHEKLELLQGVNRTYYTGSLLGFELTNTNVEYNIRLANRYFKNQANDSH